MRPYFRILVGMFIAWFGFKALSQAYGPIDAGLFGAFQYFPFILLIIVTIVALVLDTKYFEHDRKVYQYSLSLIGVTFIAIVISKFIENSSIDDSKTVLQVSNLPGGANVLRFEFKDNGKFRLTEYGRLGQTFYFGKFAKQKDTINILSSNYNGMRLPQTGLIQSDTVFWSDFDVMLIDNN